MPVPPTLFWLSSFHLWQPIVSCDSHWGLKSLAFNFSALYLSTRPLISEIRNLYFSSAPVFSSPSCPIRPGHFCQLHTQNTISETGLSSSLWVHNSHAIMRAEKLIDCFKILNQYLRHISGRKYSIPGPSSLLYSRECCFSQHAFIPMCQWVWDHRRSVRWQTDCTSRCEEHRLWANGVDVL